MMKPCLFFWIENEKKRWSLANLFGLSRRISDETLPSFLDWERKKKMESCQSFWFEQKNFWWNLTLLFGLRTKNNDEALPIFFDWKRKKRWRLANLFGL